MSTSTRNTGLCDGPSWAFTGKIAQKNTAQSKMDCNGFLVRIAGSTAPLEVSSHSNSESGRFHTANKSHATSGGGRGARGGLAEAKFFRGLLQGAQHRRPILQMRGKDLFYHAVGQRRNQIVQCRRVIILLGRQTRPVQV